MGNTELDLQQLQKLLEADWLEEEYKNILKDSIKRLIKMMPSMISELEQQFSGEKK